MKKIRSKKDDFFTIDFFCWESVTHRGWGEGLQMWLNHVQILYMITKKANMVFLWKSVREEDSQGQAVRKLAKQNCRSVLWCLSVENFCIIDEFEEPVKPTNIKLHFQSDYKTQCDQRGDDKLHYLFWNRLQINWLVPNVTQGLVKFVTYQTQE